MDKCKHEQIVYNNEELFVCHECGMNYDMSEIVDIVRTFFKDKDSDLRRQLEVAQSDLSTYIRDSISMMDIETQTSINRLESNRKRQNELQRMLERASNERTTAILQLADLRRQLEECKFVVFGEGEIGVYVAGFPNEPCDRELVFARQEPRPIGSAPDYKAGMDTEEIGAFLRFQFLNVDAVDVLIERLQMIKASMTSGKKSIHLFPDS
jgi:hypothetical protein